MAAGARRAQTPPAPEADAPPRARLAQLMYKLRKELGDADFRAIFEDPRVKGPKGF